MNLLHSTATCVSGMDIRANLTYEIHSNVPNLDPNVYWPLKHFLLAWQVLQSCRSQLHTLLHLPTTIPVRPAGFAKLQVTTPYTLVPSHNNSCWPGRFCKAVGHNSIHSCTFPQQFLLPWQVMPSCRSQLHTLLYLPTTIPVGPAGFAKLQITTPYTLVPSHNNSCWPGRFCQAAGHNSIHSCTFPLQFLLARQVLQSCRSQLHTLLYLPTTFPVNPVGFAKLQVTTPYTLVPSHKNSCWPGRFCKSVGHNSIQPLPVHNNSCWTGRFSKATGHNSIHSSTFPQQLLLAWQVLQSCRSQLLTLCTFSQQFLLVQQVLQSCRSQLHTLL